MMDDDIELLMLGARKILGIFCIPSYRGMARSHIGGAFQSEKRRPSTSICRPVAYQVIILEPGIGQFREFESPRVHSLHT